MKTGYQVSKRAVREFIANLGTGDSFSRAGLAVEAADWFCLEGRERAAFLKLFRAELNDEGLE